MKQERAKQSPLALSAGDARSYLELLVDRAHEGIIVVRSDGQFIDANPAICRLLGYTKAQLFKQSVNSLIASTEHSQLHSAIASRLKGKRGASVWHMIRKDGSQLTAEITSYCLAGGQWVVFIRDITERIKLRAEVDQATADAQSLTTIASSLRRQRRELLALNHAKDEFILIASHQLRTPATAVKQYVGMLIGGYFGHTTQQQLDILQKVYDSNERQLSVINDLLLVARFDSSNLEVTATPQDLVAFVNEITQQIQPLTLRKHQIIRVEAPDKLEAMFDGAYLQTAVRHILQNASQYSPERTTITVTLTRGTINTKVSIRDEGPGIDKPMQRRLFQKFSRLTDTSSTTVEGNGLGLYLAKLVTEKHGGRIHVTSQLGKGCTFTISLPNQKQTIRIKATAPKRSATAKHKSSAK